MATCQQQLKSSLSIHPPAHSFKVINRDRQLKILESCTANFKIKWVYGGVSLRGCNTDNKAGKRECDSEKQF